MLLRLAVVRILSQDVEQVLSLFIFLLDNPVIGCLRNQSEEQLEFVLIECVLHRKHIVISIVKNQISNTLLASLNRYPES